jgi:AP-1-like factor
MYSNTQFPGHLSQNQQDLLMAALQSNQFSGANVDTINPTSASLDPSMLSTTDGLYDDVDFNSFDDSQLFDFLDSNGQPYDPELDQLETSIDNGVAAATVTSNGIDNGRDKRKSMAEPMSDSDSDEVNPKRREGDEKQPKKPGRKPLTSEPTTVRSLPSFINSSC